MNEISQSIIREWKLAALDEIYDYRDNKFASIVFWRLKKNTIEDILRYIKEPLCWDLVGE